MKKGFAPILILIIVLILVGVGYFGYKNYLSKPQNVATPSAPSVCYPSQGIGYPNTQLDQAADSSRTFDINLLKSALQTYYSKNSKSPSTLNDLVQAGLVRSVPLDPLTKQEPTYLSSDPDHGCIAKMSLCSGGEAVAYCK